MSTAKKNVIQAAKAHTNLTVFYAVVGMLESGVVYTMGSKCTASATANKIVKLCKEEAQRQLRLHDAYVSAVEGATNEQA